MGIFDDGDSGSVVDTAAFLDSSVAESIGRCLALGMLVGIGTTRDRGAVSVQLTQDGDWTREYFRRSDEAAEWLDHWAMKISALQNGTPSQQPVASSKPRRGRRMAT